MITEDYVSFEIAKLLKEKGFLKGIDLRITQNLSFYDNIGLHHNLNKWYDSLIQDKIDFVVAPTHQMAMKWLREKGVYFSLVPFIENVGWPKDTWHINFYNSDGIIGGGFPVKGYENAVEAALKYALENLI
jgi:hypothetical protein